MVDLQIIVSKIIKWIFTQIKIEHIKFFLNKFKPLNDFEKKELKFLGIIDTQIKANKTRLSSNDFLEIETNFLKQREYINSLKNKGFITGKLKDVNTLGGGANQFLLLDCSITHAGEQYLKAHKKRIINKNQ